MKKSKIWKTSSTLAVIFALAVFAWFTNGFDFKNDSNQPVESSQTEQQPKYSNVRIFATTPADFQKIQATGLDIDHASTKMGLYSDTWLSEYEISLLQKSGVPYQILVDDWMQYYNSRPKMTQAEMDAAIHQSQTQYSVSHSIYGSMGGYLTYAEVVGKLDSMRIQYPQFISTKFSIGTTYEGRTIWAARITNGPNAPTGRPEVLYHALIHAREPESMETQMYYFYWLFENYGTDPEATYILNNREIYWIPVYNADGYEYNHTTNPTGGGMWRANRHNTGSGCGYTDPNRNYGLYAYWNSSNGGSGTNACEGGQGTYRGPSPFSEVETQSMRDFFNSRNFNSGIGAHTYGNYIIKPWSWSDPNVTPDDNKFSQFLSDMKASNPIYTTGTPSQTVGYYVRGGSDDWYYTDSVHSSSNHHAFVVTCETGSNAQGFWPAQSDILPLAQGMLFNNKYITLIGGPYVNPLSETFNQVYYTPGQSGTFKVVFRNKGVMAANNVHVIWSTTNANLSIPAPQYNVSSLASFISDSNSYNFSVAAGAPNNCAITTTLKIKLDTTTIYTQDFYVMVGAGTVAISDNAESGIGNWTTTGSWSVHTDSYHSASHSFAYAPYAANANGSLTLAAPINSSSSPVMFLTFWQRYDVENTYDFCNVEVSADNGTTWQSVAAYTGTNLTWTQQSFNITNLTGGSSQVKVRFRLTSDPSVQGQGWWVDDITLTDYCGTLTGVNHTQTGVPMTFALNQNYPNPFNPTTTIKFQIPKQAFLTIKVYDILGKLVETLVNENKDAGYYDINFDASNLASGLYIYKIEAGTFNDTKKMILIK